MTPKDRYDTSALTEDQYEPGSDGKVLKNLLGITSRDAMGKAETSALWVAEERLLGEVEQKQAFTAKDLCYMHRLWLGSIYPWAGTYRQVNLAKDGFSFAMAQTIPTLMEEFERDQLQRHTPCLLGEHGAISMALAEVHVELMLIHPFR